MKFLRAEVLVILIGLAFLTLLVLFWGAVFLLVAGTFGPALLVYLIRVATDPVEVIIILGVSMSIWLVWRKRE